MSTESEWFNLQFKARSGRSSSYLRVSAAVGKLTFDVPFLIPHLSNPNLMDFKVKSMSLSTSFNKGASIEINGIGVHSFKYISC